MVDLMKKYLITIMVLLLLWPLIKPTAVCAAPLITDNKSDEAQVMPSTPISLLSLKATVDVGVNNSTVTLQYVIKNDGKQDIHISMGYLENIAKVYNFSGTAKDIYINGQLPKGKQVVKLGTGDYSGLRWMTWPVDIKAGQTMVVKAKLYLHNKLLNDGTQAIDFPLKSMSLWQGPVKQIEVIFRFPQPMVYALDPTPQPQPSKITDEGSLVWTYSNIEPTQDILVHFKPVEYIASERLMDSGDAQLKSLADLYNSDDYVGVINKGQAYLSTKPSATYEPLIQLLMAHAYMELLQTDKAIELYDRILTSNALGDLSITAKQQALFYKYTVAQQQNDLSGQQAVLKDIMDLTDKQSTPAFKTWAAAEKNSIEAAMIIQQAQQEAAQQAAREAAKRNAFNLNRAINIKGHDIPLKYVLLIALIILILILAFIWKHKRKKHRQRWY